MTIIRFDAHVETVRRLREHERIHKAARLLDELPRVGRDIFLLRSVKPAAYPAAPKSRCQGNKAQLILPLAGERETA